MRRAFAFLIMLLGFVAGPLSAATVKPPTVTTTITITGKVTAGRDYAGFFGPWGRNIAGKAFVATYQVVTFASSSVGAGVDILGLGPTTSMTFGITINGATTSGIANTLGSVETDDGVGGAFSGGFDRVQASATEKAGTGAQSRSFDLSFAVQSLLNNIVSDASSPLTVPSLGYTVKPGDAATGRFQISQTAAPAVLSYGLLSISTVNVVSDIVNNTSEVLPVAAVPEPGEWAMLTVGLGVLGAAARRRR